MISVDISNVWEQLSLPDLLEMEKEVFDAHSALAEGGDPLGQPDLPAADDLLRIAQAAEKIRADSDVCVVVGAGGALLGSQAAVKLLQGFHRNLGKGKGDPMLLFAGNTLSTRHWNRLTGLLKEADFSVIVISGSGTVLESAIAFRGLRWMLERKYGTDEANKRIYAVTAPCRSALRQMAEEAHWETFDIPAGAGECCSPLTAAGLLPMAVAGIDIAALLQGAAEAVEQYDLRSYDNPMWLYAAVRNLLQRSGKTMELLAGWEPEFKLFGMWWQQLFGQKEGTDGKGLFPIPLMYPADLRSLDRMLRQGPRNFFETLIRFDPPEQKHTIVGQWNDPDGLNYLEGSTLDQVEDQTYQATVSAHADGSIPVITVDCGPLDEAALGQLFRFLELSCVISARVLGATPSAELCECTE